MRDILYEILMDKLQGLEKEIQDFEIDKSQAHSDCTKRFCEHKLRNLHAKVQEIHNAYLTYERLKLVRQAFTVWVNDGAISAFQHLSDAALYACELSELSSESVHVVYESTGEIVLIYTNGDKEYESSTVEML